MVQISTMNWQRQNTDSDFAADVLQSTKPALVDFGLPCGPEIRGPCLEEIAGEKEAACQRQAEY